MKEGVFIYWKKVSVFIKIRVLFGPEINALGVFFDFDNERMRPPKYPSAPPPPDLKCIMHVHEAMFSFFVKEILNILIVYIHIDPNSMMIFQNGH